MAGDWIKMRLDLQTHPKVVRILSATKADKFRAIGGLHAVWSVFDTHSSDGRLEGYTPETLDHIIGWPGFSDAMIKVGWLATDGEESLILPEFDEHNGKSGKRRAEDQKRKRDDRKSPQSVRNLSDIDADEKLTREEKRREEEDLVGEGADVAHEERRKTRRPSEEDHQCAVWLYDVLKKVNPAAKKPNWQTWGGEVRLMREIDGRAHREICELFKWAKHDPFWASNIQSPGKLREKWDMLTEKRAGKGDAAPTQLKKDWI